MIHTLRHILHTGSFIFAPLFALLFVFLILSGMAYMRLHIVRNKEYGIVWHAKNMFDLFAAFTIGVFSIILCIIITSYLINSL